MGLKNVFLCFEFDESRKRRKLYGKCGKLNNHQRVSFFEWKWEFEEFIKVIVGFALTKDQNWRLKNLPQKNLCRVTSWYLKLKGEN